MSAVAVSDGTSRRASLTAGRFRVSEVVFPPNRRLPWHAHPLGCIAIVADGVVDKRFARFEAGAQTGAMITMPPEEPHEDRFGRAGAVIVVVESQASVGHVSCAPHPEAALLAMRIRRELAEPDVFTPVAVEGLALELTALAGRNRLPARAEKWVERARDSAPRTLPRIRPARRDRRRARSPSGTPVASLPRALRRKPRRMHPAATAAVGRAGAGGCRPAPGRAGRRGRVLRPESLHARLRAAVRRDAGAFPRHVPLIPRRRAGYKTQRVFPSTVGRVIEEREGT